MVHLPLFGRQVKTTPWDRFPSDIWLPAEGWTIPFGLALQIPFSLSFLIAWFFHFPTQTEQWLWRACSLYHATFSLCGTLYYMFGTLRGTTKRVMSIHLPNRKPERARLVVESREVPAVSVSSEARTVRLWGNRDTNHSSLLTGRKKRLLESLARLENWLGEWRNISPDHDPDMKAPLRWMVPILLATFIYILCRLYFYVEDFLSLRSQPAGVYKTVNQYIPFI